MTDETHDTLAEGAEASNGQDNSEKSAGAKENYAEHLARATPDADQNKALLQARYKALHDTEQGDNKG